jgi:nucleoside-diphosphate-sugar epimerase
MKILVTGGTGFVGSNLINQITKYDVKKISRNQGSDIQGDLTNSNDANKALKDIEVLIHLAFSKNYPENLLIIKNLINACKKNKTKKIILMSSMSAKRDWPDDYGKIKREVENKVKESGLNYVILRPSMIYGKGATSFNFIIDQMNKIPLIVPIVGSGKSIIYPVHVNDVVKSIEVSLEKDIQNKEYDVVGPEKICFLDLINLLKKEGKIIKKNLKVPVFVFYITSLFFPNIIKKETIRNLTQDSKPDFDSIKELNIEFVNMQEGMKNGFI